MLEDLCLNKPIEQIYKRKSEKAFTTNDGIHPKLQKEPKYEIPTSVTVVWDLSLRTNPVQ